MERIAALLLTHPVMLLEPPRRGDGHQSSRAFEKPFFAVVGMPNMRDVN